MTPRNGTAILRPPAKDSPPGAVWQTIQFPARARYSPFSSTSAGAAATATRMQPKTRTAAQVQYFSIVPPKPRLVVSRQSIHYPVKKTKPGHDLIPTSVGNKAVGWWLTARARPRIVALPYA